MKSRLVFLYISSFVLIIVIVVLAILNSNKIEEKEEEEEVIEFESKDTITLLRSKTGQIEKINLNKYLLCVVASEMSFKYEYEALKAQTIVARTYLYNKIVNNKEENADVCDDYSHCQAFNDEEKLEKIWKEKGYTDSEILEGKNKIKKAIIETDGQIIEYNGEIIDALFHASSPVRTEDASAIWAEEDIPYLKSVENEEDEYYENRYSEVSVNYETFKSKLIENGYVDDMTLGDFFNVDICEYTNSNRVKTISVGKYQIKATVLRTLFNLKSTNFTIEKSLDNLIFKVVGYGHGVGMSQVGANTYAKQGKNDEEIIHHYYTDVEIVNINQTKEKGKIYEDKNR